MRRRRERGEERGAEIRVDIKWRGKGFEGRRKEGANPRKKIANSALMSRRTRPQWLMFRDN